MKKSPLANSLTYICTVKNGEDYVSDAVSSMFVADPSSAAVVVDDGSTDSTLQILRSLEHQYSNLTVIETQGIGRGAALNRAWRQSESEFVANLDSDDLALPGRIELQEWLRSAGPEVAVCGGSALTWRRAGAPPSPPISDVREYASVTCKLHRYNPLSHVAVVIRRSALESVGGYDESRKSQFDYDLWVRLAAAGFGLVRGPIVVGIKRIHVGQSFESKNHLRYVLSSVSVQRQAANNFSERTQWGLFALLRITWALLPPRIRHLRQNRGS